MKVPGMSRWVAAALMLGVAVIVSSALAGAMLAVRARDLNHLRQRDAVFALNLCKGLNELRMNVAVVFIRARDSTRRSTDLSVEQRDRAEEFYRQALAELAPQRCKRK